MNAIRLVGKILYIRKTKYICIAGNKEALLLLRLDEDNNPCQYVVAHGVYINGYEIGWLNGNYFLVQLNVDSADVLKKAVEAMT